MKTGSVTKYFVTIIFCSSITKDLLNPWHVTLVRTMSTLKVQLVGICDASHYRHCGHDADRVQKHHKQAVNGDAYRAANQDGCRDQQSLLPPQTVTRTGVILSYLTLQLRGSFHRPTTKYHNLSVLRQYY